MISLYKMFFCLLVLFLMPGESAFAQKFRVKKNIEYAQPANKVLHEKKLDIYAPAQKGKYPVVIWVHGGGWKFGDKSEVNLKPTTFTRAGYVLVSINYRLHPRADFRQQASDIAAAVKWVKGNISEYSGDEEKIGIMGHSAGAHLCALIGTDETYLKSEELSLTDLSAVILLDGACYHVANHIRDIPERIFKTLFIQVFTSDVAKQSAASPVEQISEQTKMPPFLIIHVADRKDSCAQSELLAESITKAGGSAEVKSAKGENHATLNITLGNPKKAATRWVFEFLEKQVKESR